MLKVNLGFFNEEQSGAVKNNDNVTKATTGEVVATEETKEEKAFTQNDMDKVISDRLKRERTKWEKETAEQIETAKTEAEKLAKMTTEQKLDHESKQREGNLLKREAEIQRRELRSEALEMLAEKGLPKSLADIINYSGAESCISSVDAIETVFKEAVEKSVDERLRGKAPKGTSVQKDISLEDKLTQARKKGNTAEIIAIKMEAAQEGKFLN